MLARLIVLRRDHVLRRTPLQPRCSNLKFTFNLKSLSVSPLLLLNLILGFLRLILEE